MLSLSLVFFTQHASYQTINCHKCTENIHKHQKKKKKNRRISPFGIARVKKAHKARTRLCRGPCRRFINTRFLKSIRGKKKKKLDST